MLRATGAKAALWRANADYLRIEGMQGERTGPNPLPSTIACVVSCGASLSAEGAAMRCAGSWPATIITPDGTQTPLKTGWVGAAPASDGEGVVEAAAAAAAAAARSGEPAEANSESLAEGSLPDPYEVMEEGVRYQASLAMGQKTGFYFDQRENRARVRRWASGARVLDLCCYSGGFAINAALGGAVSVTGVDSSASALRLASTNGAHAVLFLATPY